MIILYIGKNMKPHNFLFLILILPLFNCRSRLNENNKIVKSVRNYELVGEKDEILVEKFDSTVIDENKYNNNNTIFRVGEVFKYYFEHRTISNELKFIKRTNDIHNWMFVDSSEVDSTTIKTLEISVANGNPLSKQFPDYNQTILKYKIGKKEVFSMSGAIENEGNVWIHPPRDYYFKILELNPFPYIRAPYQIGTKWNWRLKISDQWADKQWKIWNGEIENNCTYEITGKRLLNTDLGELECFIIDSKAKSRIGETQLRTYFNFQHGFVYLEYENIDGSKTVLKIIEHTKAPMNSNANKFW